MPQQNSMLFSRIHVAIKFTQKLTYPLLLLFVLVSCSADIQSDANLSEANHSKEQEALMTLEQEWSDMYGEGNIEGIAELLASESVILVPGEPPAVGRDSVLALTRELLAAEAANGVSVSWKSEAAFVSSSGDMAYDYGRATTELANGTVIMGSYLVVWTKENGAWKVAADIFN